MWTAGRASPQIAAGLSHTVGATFDYTAVAVGLNDYGQCDVAGWTDIVRVAAGLHHTVGLKADGTVVAVGRNDRGQCDVDSWADIVQIAAGDAHTVGLKGDGSVVAAGMHDHGRCYVTRWGSSPTAPWSPWVTTPTGSAMSQAGTSLPSSNDTMDEAETNTAETGILGEE
jgi:alpha-tubulin suppressor-like RCC1 family protein